jgi:hypothetical protein
MAGIGIGSLIFFIKKQWLWVRSRNDESESVHEVNVSEQKRNNENKKSRITYNVFKKKD